MTSDNPNVTPENAENINVAEKAPKWLIAVVGILGMGLVGMLLLIVVKIIAGDHQKKPVEDQLVAEVPMGEKNIETIMSDQVFGTLAPIPEKLEDIQVDKPENAELLKVSHIGFEVLLHYRKADGGDVLLIVNRLNGHVQHIDLN